MSECSISKLIDLRGEVCPIPVMKTQKALEKMASGEILEVLVDYPAAKENIERLVNRLGSEVLSVDENEGEFRIRIRK